MDGGSAPAASSALSLGHRRLLSDLARQKIEFVGEASEGALLWPIS
jgi:hypothetical protein